MYDNTCWLNVSVSVNQNCFSCILQLQAYDQHLNMILGDVEETVTSVEIDEETYEEIYKVSIANDSLCCKIQVLKCLI